jgi:hypothetical protein
MISKDDFAVIFTVDAAFTEKIIERALELDAVFVGPAMHHGRAT